MWHSRLGCVFVAKQPFFDYRQSAERHGNPDS
jgi:hypothetical protein